MAKTDYAAMSNVIIEAVGGSENIQKVSHCFTRLRLDLTDLEKADQDAVKEVAGVKGVVVNNGQLQVIIGSEVEDLYEPFLKASGKAATPAVQENLDGQQPLANRVINAIAQMFIPVFPALAASGLLKGIMLACKFAGIVDATSPTYNMLYMFADAIFYFLPFMLAYSTARVFKVKPTLAMMLAGILLHPTYVAMTEPTSIFGLPVAVESYSSTVFPIIIGTIMLAIVDKGLRKFIPKSFAGLLVPLIDLVVCGTVMMVALGPVISFLSNILGNAIIWLYNTTGAIGGAVFGAAYPFLVFLGLHHAVVPVELQALADLGYDPLLALCAAANTGVAGAALMIAIDSKNKEFSGLSLSSGVTALLGTTEPALYGVLGILKRPFIGAAVGGAAGSAVMAFFQVYASGLGPVPGAGWALFLGEKFGFFIAGVAIALVGSMLVTHFVGFEDIELKD